MKTLIISVLTIILCGCRYIPDDWHKPDVPDVVNVITNAPLPAPVPAADCPCAAYTRTIPVPAEYVGGECDIFPLDVRVVAWNGRDWSFIGTFAKRAGLVTVSGKSVTGASKELDGRCFEYQGYRPGREANPLCTNSVGTYNGGTYRCYFKVKAK